MGLKLSIQCEAELIERTKKVLWHLAVQWDYPVHAVNDETKVLSAHLEECSDLLDQWESVRGEPVSEKDKP